MAIPKDVRRDVAYEEWEAWQVVCGELKKLGVSINDANPLHNSLMEWSRKLVELRGGVNP